MKAAPYRRPSNVHLKFTFYISNGESLATSSTSVKPEIPRKMHISIDNNVCTLYRSVNKMCYRYVKYSSVSVVTCMHIKISFIEKGRKTAWNFLSWGEASTLFPFNNRNTNEMKLTSDLLDKINKLQESSTESPKQGQQQKVPTLSDISAVTLWYTKLQNRDQQNN
jgi:hypothetical protein